MQDIRTNYQSTSLKLLSSSLNSIENSPFFLFLSIFKSSTCVRLDHPQTSQLNLQTEKERKKETERRKETVQKAIHDGRLISMLTL